jgi:hypothetical protein
MTQEEIKLKITDMFGHLEAVCNTAHDLKRLGLMSHDIYEYEFNNKIAMMESRLREIAGGDWQ